ncbi:NUDIX hydrolase [Mobilicoccus pelagius]|uniref:Putative hydrolase n=1 Tax=Mobilicoccus pelagius NBRC 104925 TaxID=1089455 RepID=H5UTE1_9MICO|nr:NUDIX hydrolase [Mobilicoccus pelagius]GAB48999.1 putative hydrolase [Mobilicoccus pelagius NBRC 104925]
MAVEIRFCRRCGTPTEQHIPDMEDRLRPCCPNCGYIDYVNPINVVGTIPVWDEGGPDERILLCRRNIEPRKGYWTLPAGFLELGETLGEGAARETREEAGARVELLGLFSAIDVVHVGQVHVLFRARLLDLDLEAGPETIENGLFTIDEIPWDELAFRTVRRGLELWVEDHRSGSYAVHTEAVG